jgi:cytochrome P450 family 130
MVFPLRKIQTLLLGPKVVLMALYDPADPAFSEESVDRYREIRDEQPLYRDPDGRFVALSRFEDVRAAATDWESFSNVGKQQSPHVKVTMNSLDPPRHSQVRGLISRGFTPRRVGELEDTIRTTARELVESIIERGEGDVIHDFAAILPSVVMGRLIGLSDEDVLVCRELTDQFMRQIGAHTADGPAVQSYEIFQRLIDQRAIEPEGDLMSALITADLDGERLTNDELLGFGWLLLVGGNDTTTNLIGNGLELFNRDRDARQLLQSDPSLIGDAVDEVLRFASPTNSSPRIATRTIETPHGSIDEGSRVLLLWRAANLDEREFTDPDRFDVRRRPSRQLALGHGVHFCIGAALTKLEARIAWEEWLAAMPDYELTQEPQHFVSSLFYGWESLPAVVN